MDYNFRFKTGLVENKDLQAYILKLKINVTLTSDRQEFGEFMAVNDKLIWLRKVVGMVNSEFECIHYQKIMFACSNQQG